MADDSLPQFIERVTGESHLRVETDLGDGFVRLRSSEAERRQAKHDIRCVEDIVIEMLRNARDAHAGLIYLATMREGDTRRIIMVDDGDGIPAHLHRAVFEPRVTSKLDTYHMDRWGVHGRGMALYSISQNAREARVVASAPGLGSAFQVVVDAKELPERTDQSSLPHLVTGEDGRRLMRGPRNINRMVAEFVTESTDAPQVFVGSPVQIAATLFCAGRRALAETKARAQVTLTGEIERPPLCLRPALARTPEELAATCQGLGLEMSARSARRIMDGQVAPVPSFLTVLASANEPAPKGAGAHPPAGSRTDHPTADVPKGQGRHAEPANTDHLRHPKDARTFTLAPEERARIQAAVRRAWQPIAQANYLDGQVQPQVRVAHDGVHVFIPAVHDDRV